MLFEALANEVLFDVFEYLNITQLFRAFKYLNSCFDKLLFIYLQNSPHFDFRSVSKRDFNYICQHHLPSITDQLHSLIFSNDDETPHQIELFFSNNLTFRQFIYLQSLSFHHIHSQTIIQDITIDLLDLINLTHLDFIDCDLSGLYGNGFHFIDNIWKLPKLIHLQLHDISNEKVKLISQRSIFSSIEYLSIQNLTMTMNDLYHFLKHKPHLRSVRVYAHLTNEDINVIGLFPSISRFELYDERSYPLNIHATNHIPEVIRLIQSMPNLSQLIIETPFIFLDGHRWKCLITTFLPKLKIFRLKMSIYFDNFDSVKQRTINIFDSFQSHFWIHEHQWFVRCHWNSENKYSQCIVFYTLPYTFPHLSITNNHLWWKSTCPNDNNHWSSSHVHHLSYNSRLLEHHIPSKNLEQSLKLNPHQTKIKKIFRLNPRKSKSYSLSNHYSTIIPSSFDKTIQMTSFTSSSFETSLTLHFPNVHKLTIELPFDEYFWWIIPKFYRLTSLSIKLSTQNIDSSQLQILIDRAPHLYSLSFNSNFIFLLINLTSESIRRLDFKEILSSNQYFFFNHEQCIALTRSSLGKQCEMLSIGVKDRKSIRFLINTMINLRALNIRCQDEESEDRELIRWLRHCLPSTISIKREFHSNHNIRLWIR
jgi:hypothetical protein